MKYKSFFLGATYSCPQGCPLLEYDQTLQSALGPTIPGPIALLHRMIFFCNATSATKKASGSALQVAARSKSRYKIIEEHILGFPPADPITVRPSGLRFHNHGVA